MSPNGLSMIYTHVHGFDRPVSFDNDNECKFDSLKIKSLMIHKFMQQEFLHLYFLNLSDIC